MDCGAVTPAPDRRLLAFVYGVPIGALGGLIGLGGAEFRLPVFKAVFRCPTRRAIALNLAVSLVTLVASLVVRLRVSPQGALLPLLPVIAGLITGSVFGAY
ncbi:MAG: TSUP family transporter, partial [Thermoanaerobaculia bacterium]